MIESNAVRLHPAVEFCDGDQFRPADYPTFAAHSCPCGVLGNCNDEPGEQDDQRSVSRMGDEVPERLVIIDVMAEKVVQFLIVEDLIVRFHIHEAFILCVFCERESFSSIR